MTIRRRVSARLRLLSCVAAAVLVAVPSLAQTPMDDPLDARDAKRLDRKDAPQLGRQLGGI